jgi:hypothetical protein
VEGAAVREDAAVDDDGVDNVCFVEPPAEEARVVEETVVEAPVRPATALEEVVLAAAPDALDARTVWPATSLSPRVASRDPPANHRVTARALRIPRRRRAPIERSGGDMTSRERENDHGYENAVFGFELSQPFLGTSSVRPMYGVPPDRHVQVASSTPAHLRLR